MRNAWLPLLFATVVGSGCFEGSGGGTAGSSGVGGSGATGATGATGGSGATGGTTNTAACEARASDSAATVQAVVTTADLGCSTNADCALVSIDTECHAACGALAGPAGRAQIEAVVASENAGRCASYQADGCRRDIPPCVQPGDVYCDAGLCAWRDGPTDAGTGGFDSGSPVAGCIDGTIEWHHNGGFVAFTDHHLLAPCTTFAIERIAAGDPSAGGSCKNLVATDATVDVDLVDVAVANPDVQAAFAAAPVLYGADSRPVDGTVFHIDIAGRAIEIGDECGGTSGCVPIPAGVAALRQLLVDLTTQQRALPDCNALP